MTERIITAWVWLWTGFGLIPWHTIYTTLKYVIIVLDLALVVGIILVLPRALAFHPRFRHKRAQKEGGLSEEAVQSYRKEWENIATQIDDLSPQAGTLAVIKADSLVDTVLKALNVPGDHMADRLENVDEGQLSSLPNLWRAHRARNQVVHSPGFTLDERDVKRYIKHYGDFLREIGAI